MQHNDNIFAVIVPHSSRAITALGLTHNQRFYRQGPAETLLDTASRHTTPGLVDDDQDDYDRLSCLILTFAEAPRGLWRFGSDPRLSDVLLDSSQQRSISRRHFSLVVTDELRVELHATGSQGLAVGYGGRGEDEVRKRSIWTLAEEPGQKPTFLDIKIHVPQKD
ncbi:hypothetical protein LTR62_001612 [Meristemomyces frigidus]|uniref:FHA domain-containing protein n=1 Tax=Meristemomyces frigidus TaxID=1508187 RepID=A0AAN7T8C8_9PEZI|nr:hypothetical protein LTR62_001612 [Meristemomyces frigidus]